MKIGNLLHHYGRNTVIVLAIVALSMSIFVGAGSPTLAAANNEEIAVSLATFLRSARAVISKNQKLINDASKGDKGLTAEVVLAKAKENYKKSTGVDIDGIADPSTLQGE